MNPTNYLSQMKMLAGVGGAGVRVVRPIALAALIPAALAAGTVSQPLNIMGDVKTTAGLTLTGATTPTIAAIETNAVGIVVASSGTVWGTWNWQVPADYDQGADLLFIDILCNSGGNTDQPTMDATIYNKRAGTAISADLNPTASAVIAKSASPTDDAAIRTITVSALGLLAGDVLTINGIFGGTRGTTDTVQIFGITMRYGSLSRGAAIETSAIGLILDNATTSFGTFNFTVPKDYDENSNELKINIMAVSGGTTDVPVLDAAIYRKRAGASLSADLNPTASAAIPNSTDKAAIRTITLLTTTTLLVGDVLTIVLSTGAHTTDTVIVHSIEVQYKSVVVFYNPATR